MNQLGVLMILREILSPDVARNYDGRWVIDYDLFLENVQERIGSIISANQAVSDEDEDLTPTHWMPLPAPPTETTR